MKLYVYVDESGQDTKGTYFIVVVVIVDQKVVSELEEQLTRIERETGKVKRQGIRKWTDTRRKEKTAYLTRLLQIPELQQSIFSLSFQNTKDYTHLTIFTLAQAIQKKATTDYQAYIMIDGLNAKERSLILKGLREMGIKQRKLVGGRDESHALLRLADAMAGFIRDHEEGQPYAQDLYRRFTDQHIITKL